MKIVVADVEADDLKATRIWCIVCKDVDTGEVKVFLNVDKNHEEFVEYSQTVDKWVFHNGINFDVPVINRLTSATIAQEQVIDTFVISRLFNFAIAGGHSLAAWGKRLGKPKYDFNDFSHLSDEMVEYCKQDVEVTAEFYNRYRRYINAPERQMSIDLEHKIAWICNDMADNGFYFHYEKATVFYNRLKDRLNFVLKKLHEVYPPRPLPVREITPSLTKNGTLSRTDFRWVDAKDDLSEFTHDCPFTRIKFEPFNPGSVRQVVEKLNQAGWKPVNKTDGHVAYLKKPKKQQDPDKLLEFKTYGWKASDEENLATIPEDKSEQVGYIREYFVLSKRLSTLDEWFAAYNKDTHRIHGKFWHIGAWTHRMSHSNPNMANPPGPEKKYGTYMRSFWGVPKGKVLIGCDAEGIQLRILAHYMNDPAFTEALVNGSKDDETDAHSMNRKALGDVCASRAKAKTFIYAWLLGAGYGKVAEIFGCSFEEAKEACEKFIEFYPGLKELKNERIPRDARNGFFVGLDGRIVPCDNEHLMLAGYLQNGEAVVMKHANLWWRQALNAERILYRQVNFVHDEWQTEVDDNKEVIDTVCRTQKQSFPAVQQLLEVNCPLAGSADVGLTWRMTH